jgi:ankyrin repeat protein
MDIEPKSTINVYFDSRISEHSLAPHKDLLEAVFQGDVTNGANVEKLRNYHIYSVRTNIKSRILFTFQQINGKNSLLVLELLENHEYDKSKFLKKNVLKKYLEKNKSELTANVQDSDFETSSVLEKTENLNSKIKFKSALESNRGHIVLDAEQQGVFSAQTPMIIEGPPGSGKTSLAEGLVKQALAKNQTVLMVTRSALLARKINQNLSQCPEYDANKVRIVAYSELFQGLIEDGKSLFEAWYTSLKQPFNASDLYEEFRIISGYDLKDYTSADGIGQKQSRFAEQKQRQQIATLYKLWLTYLKKENLKVSDFYQPTENELKKYDLVILDEAQDFSHLQLRNLAGMTKENQLIVCIDRRQNIEDENPKIIYIKNMLTELFKTIPNLIQFSTHYRCPQKIMDFAKVFNELRLQFSPKLKSEPKIAESSNKAGAVHWIEPTDKTQMSVLEKMKDDANTCVITQERFKAEAKQKLGITQVFTPEEIKGLEYKNVILYKILDSEKIYQVNSLLDPKSKKSLSDELNASAELSSCFVAATRPTETLYFVQDSKQHNVRFIIEKLKEKISTPAPDSKKTPEPIHTSTVEEWEARAKEAVERNKLEDAKAILKQHVKISDETVITLKISQWQKELNITNQSTEEKNTQFSFSKRPISSKESKEWFNSINSNDIKKIKNLLSKNKHFIDIQGQGNNTGLLLALLSENDELAELLLEAGANYNIKDSEGFTPFIISAIAGRLRIVKKILSLGVEIDSITNVGNNALMYAALKGHNKVVSELLKVGSKYNMQNNSGYTALMAAAEKGHAEVVEILLSVGADCNIVIPTGETALYFAAQNGHLDILEKLLAAGANCNFTRADGLSPLYMASEKGHVDIVEILLSAGADCNLIGVDEGLTALYVAAQNGHVKIVEKLISYKAQHNLSLGNGLSPLYIASEKGHVDIVEILLSAGANPNFISDHGQSVLWVASAMGHAKVVEQLLKAGANPDLKNNDNITPAQVAASWGHKDIVKLIIDYKLKSNMPESGNDRSNNLLTQFQRLRLTETEEKDNQPKITKTAASPKI